MLPRTPRGKIDQLALPPPAGRRGSDLAVTEPRDELDAILASVWEQILGLGPVGIHDDFYSLGGDSLSMAEAAVAASAALGRDIPFALFLEATTVAQAADLLRTGQARSLSSLVPLQKEGSLPPFFLVPDGGGEAIEFARLASHLAPDQPVYAFQVRGAKGRRALGRVDRLAAYFLQRLRQFQPTGPYVIGGYSFGTVVAYEMACRLSDQGEVPSILVLFDAPPPDPSRWSSRERIKLRTWFRRRVMLLPFLISDRPIPARWRTV